MVNEADCAQLLDFYFNCGGFGRVDWPFILVYKDHIRPCVDVMLNNGWIQPRNFSVGLGKDVMEFLEECFVGRNFFREAGCPQYDIFNNLKIG